MPSAYADMGMIIKTKTIIINDKKYLLKELIILRIFVNYILKTLSLDILDLFLIIIIR